MSTTNTIPVVKMPTVKFNQKKKLTEAECIAKGLGSTDKSKPRLGVDDNRKIAWAPANFTLADHHLMTKFAEMVGQDLDELLASVAMSWFADNKAAIELEVASFQSGDKTEAQLDRELELQLAKIETTKALLASKRAAAAPSTEPTK